jgi:hypothetical protein
VNAITSAPEFGLHAGFHFHFHGPSGEGTQLQQLVELLQFSKDENYPWVVRAVTDLVMQKRYPLVDNTGPTIDVGHKVMASESTERSVPTLGGTAIEVAFSFFPTVPSLNQPGLNVAVPDVITFMDSVIAALDQGVDSEDRIFPAGWISLRVTGRTAAFLGQQRFDRSGMVEVSLLGRPDGYRIVRLVEQIARQQGGALHWGQSNGAMRFIDLESTYGNSAINVWKATQRALGGDTFTNLFMRRIGF